MMKFKGVINGAQSTPNRQHGTTAAPVPAAVALCSVEAVTMASTPWHCGSGRGVTAGEWKGRALLLLLWKRPRPPSGHQTPADMSPKLRASLINDALAVSVWLELLSLYCPYEERFCFVKVEALTKQFRSSFPILYPLFCMCTSPFLTSHREFMVNVLSNRCRRPVSVLSIGFVCQVMWLGLIDIIHKDLQGKTGEDPLVSPFRRLQSLFCILLVNWCVIAVESHISIQVRVSLVEGFSQHILKYEYHP